MASYLVEENVKIIPPVSKTSREYDFSVGNFEGSKDLNVFYNPIMKLNRDISLLVIASYFSKPISFCDPFCASGIREMRFLKTIPELFESLTLGDISKTSLDMCKKNFKMNKISTELCKFFLEKAQRTIFSDYFNFIEIDPFGSPTPFIDSSLQQIKHRGIVSVTATDTATLCGVYPKTTFRRYGMTARKTLWYEELGLRNLIAHIQVQAGKYDKNATPILSFSQNHYYKIFFEIEDGRTKSYNTLEKLCYISVNPKSQDLVVDSLQKDETFLGKTYVGELNNTKFLKKCLSNINLIQDSKQPVRLLNLLLGELDTIGYYNISKLEKHYKKPSSKKFSQICHELNEQGFKTSRAHNNPLGIKTDAKAEDILRIL